MISGSSLGEVGCKAPWMGPSRDGCGMVRESGGVPAIADGGSPDSSEAGHRSRGSRALPPVGVRSSVRSARRRIARAGPRGGLRQADAPVTRPGRLLHHGDESLIPCRPRTRSRPIGVRPALPEGVTRGDAPVTVPPGVLAATARGRGLRGGGTARGAPIDSAPSW